MLPVPFFSVVSSVCRVTARPVSALCSPYASEFGNLFSPTVPVHLSSCLLGRTTKCCRMLEALC